MESVALLNAFGGNVLGMVVGLACFVFYRRCMNCRSRINSGCFECESPEIREMKTQRHVEVIKRALKEHQSESMREV